MYAYRSDFNTWGPRAAQRSEHDWGEDDGRAGSRMFLKKYAPPAKATRTTRHSSTKFSVLVAFRSRTCESKHLQKPHKIFRFCGVSEQGV